MPRFRSQSVILLYHRITHLNTDPWSLCVTPEHFAQHLDVLRKHRRVHLEALKPGGWSISGQLSVAITFDDGYADNFYEALPLLKRFDMPATFFIATGYLGGSREFWWDELERIVFHSDRWRELDGESKDRRYRSLYDRLQPMRHEARRQVLDEMLSSCSESSRGRKSHRTLAVEELQALARETAFEIGAHTVTHPVLAAQPIEVQYAELKDSRNWLEALLGRPVRSVSYPYGGSHHYTAATVEAVREIGFVRACTTRAGAVHRTDSPYEMARINVTDMDGEQFQKILNSV